MIFHTKQINTNFKIINTQKILFSIIIFAVLFTGLQAQNLHIKSGKVWDGYAFEKKDIYVSNGIIVEQKPTRIDSIIQAKGHYILPAFGDYHTHNFTYNNVKVMDSIFRSQGIFYAQDLANDPVARLRNAKYLDRDTTIDVKFANGCITSSQGHPIEGYERMALGVGFPRNKIEREKIKNSQIMKGRAYHILDYQYQFEDVMNTLLGSQPDAIKVILWDSENYVEDDPTANKGINPDFLPQILETAKTYQLPVVVHIETEYDLKIALASGVTHFAHPPLYGFGNDGKIGEDYPELSEETLNLLANSEGVVINPTLFRTFLNIKYLPKNRQVDEAQKQIIKDFHKSLLIDLYSTGVTFAMGADSPGLSALDEAFYYKEIGAFSNKQLINLLIQTATLIYPEDNIGKIEPGYKANLIMTEGNPVEDFSQLKNINAIIKSSQFLKIK
jgi:imidazolonepropionase-like amidohydrolase